MIRLIVLDVDIRIAKRLKKILDPLDVRASTAWVLARARFVRLDPAGITRAATLIQQQIRMKNLLTQTQFGTRHVGPQLVFLQDVVNFCFWAPKGKPRWSVEYPAGKRQDGWYAITAVFERALDEGLSILEAHYLNNFTIQDAQYIFRGTDDVPIPLLTKRHQFLRSAGATLTRKWGGSVDRFINWAGRDAGNLARSVISNFPSFEDRATIDGKRIAFYKRAQICVYNISLLPGQRIQNVEVLTAFADYKLPQLLRHLGAIHYMEPLACRVDRMELISSKSREEVEIRAATIWTCELIAQDLGVPAALVDNALWFVAASISSSSKPYHRALTTCY